MGVERTARDEIVRVCSPYYPTPHPGRGEGNGGGRGGGGGEGGGGGIPARDIDDSLLFILRTISTFANLWPNVQDSDS